MRQFGSYIVIALLMLTSPAFAQAEFGGFLQTLHGGRLDEENPTESEYTASETRLQLKMEHFADRAEFFGRLDFTYDAAVMQEYDWELREGYMKFRLGSDFDFKVGRQILTWGTGDLIFINDVFAKDYRSFFIGRDDQYLKAPQDAIRGEYYSSLGALTVVWTPRFEANRLPTGRRLSFYNPMSGGIVGTSEGMQPIMPEAKFENSEIALRYNKHFGYFNAALYYYHGFHKNPTGFDPDLGAPIYPDLSVYGVSVRGPLTGGVIWLEGGYMHSIDDEDGEDPYLPNSSVTGLFGYEKQIATNLTANIQYQADMMMEYDTYEMQQSSPGGYIRDEIKHLLTSRITKLLYSELLKLSGFIFYSPSEEDMYLRLSAEYKYTDEIIITVGGNIFDGEYEATDFGQFQKNDNAYLKLTYGF